MRTKFIASGRFQNIYKPIKAERKCLNLLMIGFNKTAVKFVEKK